MVLPGEVRSQDDPLTIASRLCAYIGPMPLDDHGGKCLLLLSKGINTIQSGPLSKKHNRKVPLAKTCDGHMGNWYRSALFVDE